MEYDWSNSSWKRMEAKKKQEDYQSKLARDMHSFHHGGGNGFNAYGGNHYANGSFTPRRHVGVGNFSSYANSFEHTSYDDYGDYGRNFKDSSKDEDGKLGVSMFDPSCHGFRVMNNASIESIVAGFRVVSKGEM
ncbi:hypothetical protein M9H77_03375 [Catharanthus roseus]|uniref:Uncharacterized protein n=1 Tax=Catharanthus roseus TaxID=4058 RepID=A0ACC0CB23_CATRO|nr:hypothetical protein M9H77_03375 [Catharanthus roseus]